MSSPLRNGKPSSARRALLFAANMAKQGSRNDPALRAGRADGTQMKPSFQTTLRDRVSLPGGIGVHSGKPVRLVLNPAEASTGLVFLRSGLPNGGSRRIEANWSKVTMTELCTVIGDGAQHMVGTVEHLVAALRGLGVDNCLVEVDGPEVPIMDGSAAAFVEAIDRIGLRQLTARRRFVKILKAVRIEQGRGFAELRPCQSTADSGFR